MIGMPRSMMQETAQPLGPAIKPGQVKPAVEPTGPWVEISLKARGERFDEFTFRLPAGSVPNVDSALRIRLEEQTDTIASLRAEVAGLKAHALQQADAIAGMRQQLREAKSPYLIRRVDAHGKVDFVAERVVG